MTPRKTLTAATLVLARSNIASEGEVTRDSSVPRPNPADVLGAAGLRRLMTQAPRPAPEPENEALAPGAAAEVPQTAPPAETGGLAATAERPEIDELGDDWRGWWRAGVWDLRATVAAGENIDEHLPIVVHCHEMSRMGKMSESRRLDLADLPLSLDRRIPGQDLRARKALLRLRVAMRLNNGVATEMERCRVLPSLMRQALLPVSQGVRLRLWTPAAAVTDPATYVASPEPEDMIVEGWVAGFSRDTRKLTVTQPTPGGQELSIVAPTSRPKLFWSPLHTHLVCVWKVDDNLMSLDLDACLSGQMQLERRYRNGLRTPEDCQRWASAAKIEVGLEEDYMRFEYLLDVANRSLSQDPAKCSQRGLNALRKLHKYAQSSKVSELQLIVLASLNSKMPAGHPLFKPDHFPLEKVQNVIVAPAPPVSPAPVTATKTEPKQEPKAAFGGRNVLAFWDAIARDMMKPTAENSQTL